MLDSNSTDLTTLLALFAVNDYVQLSDLNEPVTVLGLYAITASVVDYGGDTHQLLAVTYLGGFGILSDSTLYRITLIQGGATGDTGATGAQGPPAHNGQYTVITTGTCTFLDTTLSKPNNNNAWDSTGYSDEGYVNGVFVTFKTSQTDKYCAVGFSEVPGIAGSGTAVGYSWLLEAGSCQPVANTVAGSTVSYTTDTVFSIVYDGVNVNYFLDGVLQQTTPRATGNPLFLDSVFYNAG